jgi:hypothetical protein
MSEESPQGYMIGFRELYDAIRELDQKVDARFREDAKALSDLAARVDVLEHGATRRWQMLGVWTTCAVALLAALVSTIGPLLFHH